MDRLSRFRRQKKETVPAPAAATAAAVPSPAVENAAIEDKSPASRTPSPGSQALPVLPPAPRSRDKSSQSPFRKLHLRSSGKRAREASPASVPQSPNAAPHLIDDNRAHVSSPLSAPLPVTKEHRKDDADTQTHAKPRIPSYLTLSPHDIEAKFHELIWLERNRLNQGSSNSAPDSRFARVPSVPQIRQLDRYANIQPWENNRIRLRVPDGALDYINASPVSLPPPLALSAQPPDSYIAMQGPRQTSADHVWRMVVEQMRSPAVIVMLTETHEAGYEKCYPYFPSGVGETLQVNEHDVWGDGFRATVSCEAIEDTPVGDAIELRRLRVRVHKKPVERHANGTVGGGDAAPEPEPPVAPARPPADEDVEMRSPAAAAAAGPATPEAESEHVVHHFLFKNWPDFGVPDLANLHSFFALMRLSRAKNADAANPRIVHCSAGVGRSGTFIALEHLMRALDAGELAGRGGGAGGGGGGGGDVVEEDVIFNTVNALREQRRTMVQAEAQYLFIYQVLRKLWMDKYGVGDEAESSEPAPKRLEVDPFVEEAS